MRVLGWSLLLWAFLLWLISLFMLAPARGQNPYVPHVHGGNVPDWYELTCCNRRDCSPVENSNDIEASLEDGKPVFIHKPTGIIFHRQHLRASQDERFHVCIYYNRPICIYIPGGV